MAIEETPIDRRRWREALAAGGRRLIVSYDADRDFFALTLGVPRPAYSRDEGDLSIQVDLDTNEVRDIYIYDFERSYLPKNPDVVEWWRQVKERLPQNIIPRRPLREPAPRMTPRVAKSMAVAAMAG